MYAISSFIFLLLMASALFALASLAHSLLIAWRSAQELRAVAGTLPVERIGVTWHDFPARPAASVVQLRPALRTRAARVRMTPELRAAA